MSWIRLTVKTMHFSVLLLVCGIGLYNLNVASQKPPSSGNKKENDLGALTVIQSDEQEQDDGIAVVETEDEIVIENPEPFIPTNEWQLVKPGQAIPHGLHVRLNLQTGQKEARLMQEENRSPESHGVGDKFNLDELKKAVKSVKSEGFESVDMETLRKERQFRSYEELKADMEKMNADIQTDAEIVGDLVEKFRASWQAQEDVSPLLEQLEYYLHQIDNAMLFCDLGAMPVLLGCLNSSAERVRSQAALVLGSALQSNPKVQIAAVENGALHEVLKLVALDGSPGVRKRALYALSAMTRHFPYAQKRLLDLGGLSVLGKLFGDELKSSSSASTSDPPAAADESLRVRAVTLLTDLVKEKELHSTLSNAEDSSQEERLRQYREINLQEAMVKSGWCRHISSLLVVPEHDSREKILVAMETVLPACEASFSNSTPELKTLWEEYKDLVEEERRESPDGQDDGFYQGLVNRLAALLDRLSVKEEL